ncbi:tRNA pseudouridine(38-40) synthase TruA [Candidatus Symbiothrix dinenymphae]|uniref:tRNA pseudouridine(38-40) synthase TruA n=1 Tax=Candidatus Symbiothrix dinenymphae TaxID=467085 RepID=UPI0009EC24F4|nr:tRNA pseudouridine(38-40) synthase TruA [Candidatus Symbiothrix dinenymphae]
MNRYFIFLAYNGQNYCGWQYQNNAMTVQATIQNALMTLLQKPVGIVGAGRTDTGVHAREMVAHFDCAEALDLPLLTDKLNRVLPRDIVIYRIVPVRANAHARFSALSRTYQYVVTHEKDPFNGHLMYRISRELDYDLMNKAAQILFEFKDFTSFSKLHTETKTNNCTIMHARWEQQGSTWVFTIQANRFLRSMVRAVVGTLLEVGRGRMTPDEFRQVIINQDRNTAGASAPAQALSLVKVEYDDSLFDVPDEVVPEAAPSKTKSEANFDNQSFLYAYAPI